MEINIISWLSLALVPISNVVTWLITRQKRKNEQQRDNNDTLVSMQATIDRLVSANEKLYKTVMELWRENLQLQNEVQKLQIMILEKGGTKK